MSAAVVKDRGTWLPGACITLELACPCGHEALKVQAEVSGEALRDAVAPALLLRDIFVRLERDAAEIMATHVERWGGGEKAPARYVPPPRSG